MQDADGPDEATLYRLRSRNLSWRETEGALVVLDLDSNIYLQVNATGMTLWDLLERGATIEELSGALQEAYSVGYGVARADALAFISVLKSRDFLEH
jgi:hypothetical protein